MNRQVSLRVTVEILTNTEDFDHVIENLSVAEEVLFNNSDELTSHNIENLEFESAVRFDEDDDIDLLK